VTIFRGGASKFFLGGGASCAHAHCAQWIIRPWD